MKYQSSKRGEFPPSVHWTEGECRELELPEGTKCPEWLKPIKATKKKTKEKEE